MFALVSTNPIQDGDSDTLKRNRKQQKAEESQALLEPSCPAGIIVSNSGNNSNSNAKTKDEAEDQV